ncbi:MAG: four helix bundle protein [Thermoguttaceae bacterium]
MRDFRKLQVWNKAHQMALSIYQSTRAYPHEELYGLTSQTRRACVSIPANIAEGCGRGTVRELDRFFESHQVPPVNWSAICFWHGI